MKRLTPTPTVANYSCPTKVPDAATAATPTAAAGAKYSWYLVVVQTLSTVAHALSLAPAHPDRALALSVFLSLSLSGPLSLSRTLSRPRSLALSPALSLSFSRSLGLPLSLRPSLSFSRPRSLSVFLSVYLSLSRSPQAPHTLPTVNGQGTLFDCSRLGYLYLSYVRFCHQPIKISI